MTAISTRWLGFSFPPVLEIDATPVDLDALHSGRNKIDAAENRRSTIQVFQRFRLAGHPCCAHSQSVSMVCAYAVRRLLPGIEAIGAKKARDQCGLEGDRSPVGVARDN